MASEEDRRDTQLDVARYGGLSRMNKGCYTRRAHTWSGGAWES